MMEPFNCTRCGEESALKASIPGDVTGEQHAVFECANCGQIDRRSQRGDEPSSADDSDKKE
jgi:transcription elongation factor Elf1